MIIPMARIRIVGPKTLLPPVTAALQEAGSVQVDSEDSDIARIRDDLPAARRLVPDEGERQARERLESLLDRVRKLLLLLPPEPEKPPLPAATPPPPLPADSDAASLTPISQKLTSVASRLEALLRKRRIHADELSLFARYDKVLRVLAPLIAGVRESRDLECTGLAIQAGERDALPLLEEALGRATGGHYEIFYRAVDRETMAGLLVFPREKAAAAKALLWERNIGELRLPASVADKPLGEALGIIRRKQAELPTKIARVDAEIAAFSRRWTDMLSSWRRALEARVARMQLSETFFETRETFLLCGWVPVEQLAPLHATLAARFGELVLVERLPVGKPEEHQVPVALRNGPLVRPYERFTRALPLPRYGTIDPTPLVAVFFPLFYGAIIGDAGYGLLLFAGALFVRRRYAANPLARDFATIFLWASLSATAWGFAYGELFGDLGERFGMRPLFLDRMKDFMANIAFALGIGVCHVLLGIGLGIATAVRGGHPWEVAVKAIGLLIVLAFLAVAAGVAGKLPPAAAWIGGVLLVAAVPALLLSPSRSAIMEFHNLVNILSYLRIMGIGVASVALAFAANKLVALSGSLAIGIPAAILLHTVNIAFGLFSPAIQSMRLHYVEFFENFFVGGGRPYVPFRSAP